MSGANVHVRRSATPLSLPESASAIRRPQSFFFTTWASRRLLLWLYPVLAITLWLLLTSPLVYESWPTKPPLPPRLSRPPPYFPPPGYLKSWIEEEDRRYELAVMDRWDLVRKYGPRLEDIQAFPTDWKPYTLWDFFIPAFRCPHSSQRVGQLADGGKWVCGMELIEQAPKCVVYSFGISSDSSFEAELLNRAPGCEVWGYDFSVRSFGPQISLDPELASRAHFHKWGLAGIDAHNPGDNPPMYTLRSLMALNGHTFIDVLKIDIEGAEFDALMSFIASAELSGTDTLPWGQLQLEIHVEGDRGRFKFFMEWWELLERFGLRPFWFEPNLVYVNIFKKRPDTVEYSFINIRGNHALISD